MKRIMIVIGVVAVIIVGWWAFTSTRGDGAQPTVDTDTIDRGDITRIVSSVGQVRALITVEVGSQLSGQIVEIHADFNSPVQQGDLLAVIDPQTFARRLQEAEANLAVARATVAIQAATIDKAEANQTNAQREYERQQSLVRDGSVSRSALDAAEAASKSARADVAIARAQHQNALATVEQRLAALEAARIDLERTQIRSPITGVVIDRAVDPGQTVAASLAAPILFLIAQDLTAIQIEANVDEADIGTVEAGAEAEFSVDAHPDQRFTGTVAQVRLAPIEEQNVVTYTVIINARNPDRLLLPGMTANVEIVTGRRENVLRISNAAVRFRPPGPAAGGRRPAGGPGSAAAPPPESTTGPGRAATVYVPAGSEPEPREVRLGISDDRYTELVAGPLDEGDAVVTRIRQPAAPER